MDWTEGSDDWLAEREQLRREEMEQEKHDAHHGPGARDERCSLCAEAIEDDLTEELARKADASFSAWEQRMRDAHTCPDKTKHGRCQHSFND